MDIIQLMPRLHFLRLPVGQAYLWNDPDGLTLIDAGLPGSAPLIADAIHPRRLNWAADRRPEPARRHW